MFDQLILITRDLLMDYMYSMDAVFSLKRRNSSKSTYSNWIQLKNSDISGALKLNVKMAPEMSGLFNLIP